MWVANMMLERFAYQKDRFLHRTYTVAANKLFVILHHLTYHPWSIHALL